MARESQGLQIALIIFFMLTVVLGVTTYRYQGMHNEALKQAQANQQTANQERSKTAEKEAECAKLKALIGHGDRPLKDIEAAFEKDIKDYGMAYPSESRTYAPLIARLWETITARAKTYQEYADRIKELDEKYANLQKSKDDQIKQLEEQVKASGGRVTQAIAHYTENRQSLEKLQAQLTEDIKLQQKAAEQRVGKSEAEVKRAQDELNRKKMQLREVINQYKMKDRTLTPVTPAGDITWVDQRSAMAWINLGRLHNLQRQTTFGVYSSDVTDLGKAERKATIEVTRILGDSSAECRIVEDKTSNPILPGDKVFTAAWTPGEIKRFALVGIMNLDGDGRNALGTARVLVTQNGGQVECSMDENGRVQGSISTKIHFLVLGDEPKDGEMAKRMGQLVHEADAMGIQKMTLSEFKQKMNYRKLTGGNRVSDKAGAAPAAPPKAKPAAAAPAPAPAPAAKKASAAKAEDLGF